MQKMAKHQIIKKGTLFTVTDGEYSSYRVESVCRALVDIDVADAEKEYLDYPKERSKIGLIERVSVTYWLTLVKMVATELDFAELHTGDDDGVKFDCWGGG